MSAPSGRSAAQAGNGTIDRRRVEVHRCPRCRGKVELRKVGATLMMGTCSACARSFGRLR